MMDYCLAYLYWTVQIEPVALIATVSFFTVITLVGIFSIRKKEANYTSVLSDKYHDVKDKAYHETAEQKKVIDYNGMFDEFRHSRLYAEIVVALVADDEIQEQNLTDLKKVLYEFFIEFRLYLYEIGPKLSDTDIDFCILTLAGIKQKHIYKLMGISPSGIRLKKKRIKEKVPARVYWNIFWVEHCIY